MTDGKRFTYVRDKAINDFEIFLRFADLLRQRFDVIVPLCPFDYVKGTIGQLEKLTEEFECNNCGIKRESGVCMAVFFRKYNIREPDHAR